MKTIEPAYQLEQMGESEWRFVFSAEMEAATSKFDDILEFGGGKRGLTVALRAFLNEYPSHIDALHHYAMCKMQDGKPLDALAFAHTAVGVARSAFPKGFQLDNNCLPGGWIENRPFLRALHGLMIAQRAMYQTSAAIQTGRDLLGCESQDRMGVRLTLPLYLLELGRNIEAMEIFDYPDFEGCFGAAEYLHALALIRLGRETEIPHVLKPCFRYCPAVADYLLNPDLPHPKNESPLGGIIMGSAYEGWTSAVEQRRVWDEPAGALDLLREAHTQFKSSQG